MLKQIFKILKNVLFSVFFIYGYNLIAAPLGVIIPINLWTISFVSILGVPALLSLIVIFIVVF